MKTKPSETLRQMALTDRKLSWLGAVAETIAELEEDNARKDDAIADQARKIKGLLAQLMTVKRERDAAVRDVKNVVTHYPCYVCKHSQYAHGCGCDIADNLQCEKWNCRKGELFEWRGPCAENGGENV